MLFMGEKYSLQEVLNMISKQMAILEQRVSNLEQWASKMQEGGQAVGLKIINEPPRVQRITPNIEMPSQSNPSQPTKPNIVSQALDFVVPIRKKRKWRKNW